MGTNTIMLGFKLKDTTRSEDLWPLVPDMMSMVMKDVRIVYPTNGLQATLQRPLVVAMGNHGRSHATLSYHGNHLLTLDVQHECSKEALEPMKGPYTLEYIRTIDAKLQKLLAQWFEHSVSLYAPIRRQCRGPRNYTELGDDRLYETDYVESLCDVISPYQRVSIVRSLQFGRVLTLDDDIMLGENDDVYTTTVLGLDRGNNFSGARVLILGGGDGGLLYRLVSLDQPPLHVIMAEIDEEVMKACKQHMPRVCGHVFDNYSTPQYTICVALSHLCSQDDGVKSKIIACTEVDLMEAHKTVDHLILTNSTDFLKKIWGVT